MSKKCHASLEGGWGKGRNLGLLLSAARGVDA